VSELNNPFPALEPEQLVVADPPSQVQPPVPAPDPINPHAENPPWTGLDLLLMALVLIGALFLFTTISFGISTLFSHRSVKELAKDPGTLTIVPAMAISYLFVMGFMYFRLARVRNAQFWQAVSWRWPSGNSWLGFVIAGGVTAIAMGLLSRFLPMPKSLPVDRFFGDRRSAYLMVFFGVLIAPLAEELLFRGFLYPVLDRWMETLFMFPQRLRRGSLWICVVAGWGYLVHQMPHSSARLLAGLIAIPILGIFLARSTNPRGKPAQAVLLPGVSILVWGFVARSLPGHSPFYATAVLLALAVVLMAIGLAPAWHVSSAGMVGRILAVLVTSGAFAMMHSDQLGSAWAPLLVLFVVGCVLTLTRVITRAVAPGVLLHMGYNGTLFGLMYIATDHFRHMERMTQ
jgi:membrane protease YdiL (CAAX protease family)